MKEYFLVECSECSSVVNKLSQCEICGKLVCDQCLDPFAGTCKNCAEELFNGNMRCIMCGLKQRLNDLRMCSSCGRIMCAKHFTVVCEKCFEELSKTLPYEREEEPYFPEEEEHYWPTIDELGDYNILEYLHPQHEVQEY